MDEHAFGSIAVPWPVPVVLSIVAGYVDSCTYLGLFGVFVAQLTGSFVLAGTQFIKSEPGALAKLLAIPFFLLRWHGCNGAGSLDERAPTYRFSLELDSRKHVADRISCSVSSRHALPRSGRAGRDSRIDVRNDSDGRTKRDSTAVDAGHALDQRDDHKYNDARDQCG
jgi:hypothetical protein